MGTPHKIGNRLNGFRPVSASRGTWLKPGVNETGAGEHHELTFEAQPYASVFCIDRTDRKHMFRGSDSNIGGVAAKLKTSPAGKPEAYRYVLRQSRTPKCRAVRLLQLRCASLSVKYVIAFASVGLPVNKIAGAAERRPITA